VVQPLQANLLKTKQVVDNISMPLEGALNIARIALSAAVPGSDIIMNIVFILYDRVKLAVGNVGGCEKLFVLVCWCATSLEEAAIAGTLKTEVDLAELVEKLQAAKKLLDKFGQANWVGRMIRASQEATEFAAVHEGIKEAMLVGCMHCHQLASAHCKIAHLQKLAVYHHFKLVHFRAHLLYVLCQPYSGFEDMRKVETLDSCIEYHNLSNRCLGHMKLSNKSLLRP
jgi:hypothetical protein